MKILRVICLLALCCMVAGVAACSGADNDSPSASETTTSAISEGAGEGQGQADGMCQTEDYWEVETLDALDALVGSADGYAYYYLPDPIPADLEFSRAGVGQDGVFITLDWRASTGQRVTVFLLWQLDDPSTGRFSEMVVNGRTYYCTLMESTPNDSYFVWQENDGVVINVHPGEPITEEVIRKYGQVRKVEHNVGKSPVGLGTGRPLVTSLEKVEAILRDNQGIKYQQASPLSLDGLLVP